MQSFNLSTYLDTINKCSGTLPLPICFCFEKYAKHMLESKSMYINYVDTGPEGKFQLYAGYGKMQTLKVRILPTCYCNSVQMYGTIRQYESENWTKARAMKYIQRLPGLIYQAELFRFFEGPKEKPDGCNSQLCKNVCMNSKIKWEIEIEGIVVGEIFGTHFIIDECHLLIHDIVVDVTTWKPIFIARYRNRRFILHPLFTIVDDNGVIKLRRAREVCSPAGIVTYSYPGQGVPMHEFMGVSLIGKHHEDTLRESLNQSFVHVANLQSYCPLIGPGNNFMAFGDNQTITSMEPMLTKNWDNYTVIRGNDAASTPNANIYWGAHLRVDPTLPTAVDRGRDWVPDGELQPTQHTSSAYTGESNQGQSSQLRLQPDTFHNL